MATNLRVLDDKMIVKNLTTKTAGGLILPGMVVAYTMYEIVAIGPGHYLRSYNLTVPNEVKVGDRVLINYGSCKSIGNHKNPKTGEMEELFLVDNSEEAIMVLDEDETVI